MQQQQQTRDADGEDTDCQSRAVGGAQPRAASTVASGIIVCDTL
jgi:hypothetical protein